MKKIIQFLIIVFAFNINAKIEVLDRVAVIVDDGVIMESQIKNNILDNKMELTVPQWRDLIMRGQLETI